MSRAPPPSALSGVRVLEIASPLTRYCGKMFADLGADVILIEPPGGCDLRREPPFARDVTHGEASLAFAYYHTSKRGITLDLESAAGQAAFRSLASDADLVLEGEKPGVMSRRGLEYEQLRVLNPRLVVASVTPFGQSGPYAAYEATDLIGLAMGGLLYLGGYPDAAPTRVYGEQAYSGAAMYAAVSALLALTDAEMTGVGQHVDVSMQECVVMAMETAVQFYDLERTVRKRYAGEQRFAGTGVFECRDGYIYMMASGIGANKFWSLSIQWLTDEQVPGVARLHGEAWNDLDYVKSDAAKRIFAEVFGPWAKTRTKSELYREGQRRHIPLAPINTPADILASPQLAHREYFVEVKDPQFTKPILMPGAPYRLSRTPWRIARPAPRVGEHDKEVLAAREAGAGRDPTLKREAREDPSRTGLPLAGVRVTDFTWIGAGSYATKILADFGADVIKIESARRIDSLRMAAPYKDGIKGVNRSGYFADRNANKRSITIDMKHPRALAIVERLIAGSDIVANNFTPGVMERFGLGYDVVRAIRSDVIYVAMSMQGSSGPEHQYLGYGASMVALTGLQYLTGLPGREPAGTGTNFPDHIPNPCHAAFAVLAALRHRRRTGEGQYIDIAQTEPTIALLGPAFLDLTVNGRLQQPNGNEHPLAAPHGVYPCRGDDRWIAIAVMTDAQWRALVTVLGEAAWGAHALERREDRQASRAALDRKLAAITVKWEAEALMHALQSRGVPAGIVQTAVDVVDRDPQLRHRGHWVTLDHLEMGPSIYNAPPVRFSRTPVQLKRPAPCLGQHTEEICREVLGLSDAEILALREAQVLA